MKTIALLPAGSVSDEAAKLLFQAENINYKYHRAISDVFLSTVNKVSQYSVIPIENTIDGSVSLHLDWLIHEVNLPIQAEWVYPSIQNLIGRRSELENEEGQLELSRVKKIISHPVAMAQCLSFIRENMPHAEMEYVGSTSESVKIVREHAGEGLVAIGTRLAAQNNNLDLLISKVTDHDNNYTRFFLVGEQPFELNKASKNKTSLLITLPEDYPGALHQVLSALAWRKINMSRIESRPTKKKLGSYHFYIEILMSSDQFLLQSAIQEIEVIGCHVRILGSYPSFKYEQLI